MMEEATPSRTALVRRARRINRELARLYPDARIELNFASPLELLVAAILSAERPDPPFEPVRGLPRSGVHWVEPRLVAQVGFTEWTADGRLRHPRFQGLRRDKNPADVVQEMP